MNRSYLLFILIIFLISCSHKDNNTGAGSTISPRIKRQVMALATSHAMNKFKNAKKAVMKDGIVIIGDDQIRCIIDPAGILTGLIDDDEKEDVIISIPSYKGQFLIRKEHLILIRTGGKFKVGSISESDMKIMEIKDKLIKAEVPKFAPDSPNYNCELCQEVVKFMYKDGELVRLE